MYILASGFWHHGFVFYFKVGIGDVCVYVLLCLCWLLCSWKVPTWVQINKYTMENIKDYIVFLWNVVQIPLHKFKFLDKRHFVDHGVFAFSSLSLFYICVSSTHSVFPALLCQKILSPYDKWPQLINTTGLDKQYTLSILTTLDEPIYFSLQKKANT